MVFEEFVDVAGFRLQFASLFVEFEGSLVLFDVRTGKFSIANRSEPREMVDDEVFDGRFDPFESSDFFGGEGQFDG